MMLAAPQLIGIPTAVTVQSLAPLQVPIDGFDADGDALTFSVTSTNPNIVAEYRTGRSLVLNVTHTGTGPSDPSFSGRMVFQLFEDLAPRTSGAIAGLAADGFYDGLTFHRVISGFVIQGGSRTGDGLADAQVPDFDDEFHFDLQHTGVGLLSMAKSRDDSNDSQFFVTAAPTRHLDSNHSIFGRLVEGEDIRQLIDKVPKDGNDVPLSPVRITSAQVIQDTQNRVLTVKTAANSGSGTVTVTVMDAQGQTATHSINVTAAADNTPNEPFLNKLDPAFVVPGSGPASFQISARDVDGGAIFYYVRDANGNLSQNFTIDKSTGLLTLRAPSATTGFERVEVIASSFDNLLDSSGRVRRGGNGAELPYDAQIVPVYFNGTKPIAPTIDLLASSDTGSSTTDNLTSKNNQDANNRLEFRVSNVIRGSRLTVNVDGATIFDQVVDVDSVTVRTNGSSKLADGAHSIAAFYRASSTTLNGTQPVTNTVESNIGSINFTVDSTGPELTGTGNGEGVPGVAFSRDLGSPEEGAGGLRYELVSPPTGATIDANTGVISWTPTTSQVGTRTFQVRGIDRAGNATNRSFDVVVTTPPSLGTLPDRGVVAGVNLTFEIQASDADLPNDALTYSIVGNLPEGATFVPKAGNPNVAVFSWTPTPAQSPNEYTIQVRVTDQLGGTDTKSFKIFVAEPKPPSLLGIANFDIAEGTPLRITAVANDENLPFDKLTYSLAVKPDGATINADTGQINWTPSEAQGPGNHLFRVRVTDLFGLFAETEFSVAVSEINTGPQLAPISTKSVNAGEELKFVVQASDADLPAQALTFSLGAGAPEGATIDPATGEFKWTPAAGTPKEVSIKVVVSDGALTAERMFQVNVNLPPELGALPGITLDEGTTRSTQLSATDPNGTSDTLTYSLVGSVPENLTVSPTGFLRFSPTEAQGPGSYSFTVRVTDQGGLFSERTVSVTVNEVDSPPVIAAIENRNVNEGGTVEFVVSGSDPDIPAAATPPVFSLGAGAPVGATIDPATGAFRWATNESHGPGTFPVTVRLTDAGGKFAERTFNITVAELNTAPTLQPIDAQSVDEGALVTFTARATDVDLPAQGIRYSLGPQSPANARIDAVTGVFTWIPSEAQGPSITNISIIATDGGGLSATTVVSITVAEVNESPVLGPIADQSGNAGEMLRFFVGGMDSDLPANGLTYELVDGPAGATLDPATGEFVWNVPSTQTAGDVLATVRVLDAGGLSAEQTVRIGVQDFQSTVVFAINVPGTGFFGQRLFGFDPSPNRVQFAQAIAVDTDLLDRVGTPTTPALDTTAVSASIGRIQAGGEVAPVEEENPSAARRGGRNTGSEVERARFEQEVPAESGPELSSPFEDTDEPRMRGSAVPGDKSNRQSSVPSDGRGSSDVSFVAPASADGTRESAIEDMVFFQREIARERVDRALERFVEQNDSTGSDAVSGVRDGNADAMALYVAGGLALGGVVVRGSRGRQAEPIDAAGGSNARHKRATLANGKLGWKWRFWE